MVTLEKAVVARLKAGGETFEILVDPELALKFKEGEEIDLRELLAIDEVFVSVRSGEKASHKKLIEAFGTDELTEIVRRILREGEVQLTVEQRRRMKEEKLKRIAALIARNAINPQTNTPHPPPRIEKALMEVGFEVNIFKAAEEQVEAAIKAISHILPIRITTLRIAVKLPASVAARCYQLLHSNYGEVEKEEWGGEHYYCLLRLPAGLRDEFYAKLLKLSSGEAQVKEL